MNKLFDGIESIEKESKNRIKSNRWYLMSGTKYLIFELCLEKTCQKHGRNALILPFYLMYGKSTNRSFRTHINK